MKHSTATVIELNAAKRLILKRFGLVIRSLMHISGLTKLLSRRLVCFETYNPNPITNETHKTIRINRLGSIRM